MILAIRVVPPTRIDVETSGRPRRTARVPHAHIPCALRPSPSGRVVTLRSRVLTPLLALSVGECKRGGPPSVAGVSKYHFARCFEAAYGETPIRYLTRRRIERAQDLLRAANLTVTEICMAVGFSSLGSFSTRFSALVGESPTQYRDRCAATGGPRIPGCYLFMMGVVPSTSATSKKPGARAPA